MVDRAMRAFWRRGWSATSIRELESELELKAPSIYRRFGSKDGLARVVLEQYVDQVIGRRIERYLPADGDPLDNVWRFLDSALVPPADGDRLTGCLLTATATEHPALAAELDDVMARGFAMIRDGFAAQFERAAAAGQLAPGVDAGSATVSVDLAFQGLMVHARRSASATELAEHARTVLRSIAPDWNPPSTSSGGCTFHQ
ncbi:MAG: TetR/AcrR family transcriptional regulator [Actinomycetota bacterium]